MFNADIKELNFSERYAIGSFLKIFKVPSRLSTKDWMEKNLYLTSKSTAMPGQLDCSKTPWLLFLLKCLDDPAIKTIVCKKSSRFGWTTIINGYVGKVYEQDKLPIAIAFARSASRKKYFNKFLKPMLLSTPILRSVLTKYNMISRLNHTQIEGENCHIDLLNMGVAMEGKGDNYYIIIVEEPDDTKDNVSNQGDSLTILSDRKKTVTNYKFIFGGTPVNAITSQILPAFNVSSQHEFMCICHYPDCRQFHAITNKKAFDNLRCDPWPDGRIDITYGPYDPNTAKYYCPHCNRPWTDKEKNANVYESINYHELGWKASNPEITDVVGIDGSELVSNFTGTTFVDIAKAWLIAKKEYSEGKEGKMKAFVNTRMGEGYSPISDGVDISELELKRLSYPEGFVVEDGIILLCTIDKQRGGLSAKSRFECEVRAVGKNGCTWLVQYKIIEGNTTDYSDKVWTKLTEFINTTFPYLHNPELRAPIQAVAIDAGDDTQLVYRWVADVTRTLDENGNTITPKFCSPLFGNAVFAVKGSSQEFDTFEIYNDPRVMEFVNGTQMRKSLAETYGTNVYIMGTYKSHEELHRRLNLNGEFDRWYHCQSNFLLYEVSLLSCSKSFTGGNRKGYWQQIPGKPKEARDTSRMILWLMHAPLFGSYNIVQLSNENFDSLKERIFYNGETYENED